MDGIATKRSDETRDYAFGDSVLALRKRAGLTQARWAATLGASKRTIEGWEAGLTYPGVERLTALVTLALERGLFTPGREEEEAAALWDIPRQRASQRIPPFEAHAFPALRRDSDDALPAVAAGTRWQDWGEAPAVAVVQGRAAELATLARYVRAQGCRVVEVLGAGGIGKTTLAAQLVHDLAPEFAVVYWRSLRNALPVEEWLAGAIAALSVAHTVVPEGDEARLALLLDLLRGQRGLLVLDNLETVLEPGVPEVRYRAGYEGYGAVLRQLAEGAHEGIVLLTSREQPLPADDVAVRALHLGGLATEDGRALLGGRALSGDEGSWQTLVGRYQGNPLALRVVGETIAAVFGGEVAAFLSEETAVFGGIRELLDAQVSRLSAPERTILDWLVVEREPVRFAALVADLGPGVARGEVVEAVEALRRRSLLEWGAGGAFTLQPVVLEYTTARLVAAVAGEIAAGEPALLVRQPLLRATARDYARRGQERLIAGPLLERLGDRLGGAEMVEERLLALLARWRGRPPIEQGYGPGNVVNLLRLLRGDLRGVDLSRVFIRQAYLQDVVMQDASLANARMSETVLGDAFAAITRMALSADGAYVAAGTMGGEVRVWRVTDSTLLATMQAHAGGVLGIAFSEDGRLLATGSMDGTVRLWEARTGRAITAMEGQSGGVWSVTLAADGRTLISGGVDGAVRLWDAGGGRPLATLEGHAGAVMGVALSTDARLVVSTGRDGVVRLWEVGSGRTLATLEGHTNAIWDVALSAQGRLVASASMDGTVRLWDTGDGRPLATLEGHAGGVYGAALSADGRLVASGGMDRTVRLWDAASGQSLAVLEGHTDVVTGVALSADGQLVASGGMDGAVRLWDAASGHPLATLRGYTSGIWNVALSADGRTVASGGMDRTVRLWDTESGRPLTTLEGHTGGVLAVALSAAGELVASCGNDGTVRLWDTASGRPLATLEGGGGEVWGVALSADGRLVASGSIDSMVRLWDARDRRLVATLGGNIGIVLRVALSADGRLVASGGMDGTVRLWDTASGQPLVTLEGHSDQVEGVALSADGRLVASGGMDGAIRLWDVEGGRLLAILAGHTAGIWTVALSADGRLVASGSFDGTARLWEAPAGKPLATLEGHSGVVYGVALSADGRLAASSGLDGTVRLWDTTSGVCLHTLRADRRYERLDITGLSGVTEAQRVALHALGAVEQAPALPALAAPAGATSPPASISGRMAAPTPEPTDARSPTNLPPERTSFVGRAADVAALTQALDPGADADTRLLTLSGVAGSGKTRLALAAAEALRDRYEDGIWLVELAPLPANLSPDPTAVAGAALIALGLHEQPGRDLPDTLAAHMHTRRLLLVLDNCEHLTAACGTLVTQLLAACPELRVLATSQRPLEIEYETMWRVDTLAAPSPVDGTPTPADLRRLAQAEAVQLFVERARAVQPDFALDAGNAGAVAAICRRLDGLPLAIELAAARLHVLPVEEVLARLQDRFALLRRGGRTVADRHQALQATLDWSYDLLDPAEQATLRRLAVFAGGWELAAAEAVCAGGDVATGVVLELLDDLADRSLVYVYRVRGAPRYGLLETVRAYGLRQLERADETEALRDRHLRWCVTLTEQAAPALLGAEQGAWLARLEREHDNLRAALQWALDRGRGALGLRLAAGLWQFWRSRSYLSEGRRWLAAVLALPTDDDASRAARASALEGAGWLTADEHDFAQASALFAQSEALHRALGQDERTTGLLINEAMEARARGDYARATALLEESLAQQRARGNRESIKRGGLGLSLARLALVLAEQGQHTRALSLYEECLALHRELGDREGIGNALLGLGDIARDLGDTAGVRAYCEQTLALFQELGHTWVGFSLNDLALADYLDGDLSSAARRAEEAVTLFRHMQAGPSLAEVLVTLGRMRAAQGEVTVAQADLAEALALARPAGPRLFVAAALDALGVLAVRQGQPVAGARLLGAAARIRREMGTPVRPADRTEVEGAVAAARAALGDAPFAEIWAAAQALPLERIIDRAVEGPGDDRSAPDVAEF